MMGWQMAKLTVCAMTLVASTSIFASSDRQHYKNSDVFSETTVSFNDSGPQGFEACEISKKTKKGFLSFFADKKKNITIFTNSIESYKNFAHSKKVYLSVLDSITSEKIIDKLEVFPLNESEGDNSSIYIANYRCKIDMDDCISPYIDNHVLLSSGVNSKIFDSFSQILDGDAILTFNNCLDGIGI